MESRKKSLKGFTLIEVMVAMLVLAIGLLGLAGITAVVIRTNLVSQQVGSATQVAMDLMEKLKNKDADLYGDCSARASVSTCTMVTQSGLNNDTEYYPMSVNGTSTCGVAGVFDVSAGTTLRSFDIVRYTSNGIQFATNYGEDIGQGLNGHFNQATDPCSSSIQNLNLPSGYFVRYFRSYAPAGSATSRNIAVVILWKDRFGRWRNTHLKSAVK